MCARFPSHDRFLIRVMSSWVCHGTRWLGATSPMCTTTKDALLCWEVVMFALWAAKKATNMSRDWIGVLHPFEDESCKRPTHVVQKFYVFFQSQTWDSAPPAMSCRSFAFMRKDQQWCREGQKDPIDREVPQLVIYHATCCCSTND